MTIDEMPAGREMDVRVALEVFNEPKPEKPPSYTGSVSGIYNYFEPTPWRAWQPECVNGEWEWVPVPFSEKIVYAWEVIEKLHAAGRFMHLDALGFDGEKWRCFFAWTQIEKQQYPWIGEADTAPLAICRAALKAVTP